MDFSYFDNTVSIVILLLSVIITCCACTGILSQLLREPINRNININYQQLDQNV